MASKTPRRLVHWALDPSLSDLASPGLSEGPSLESASSTSTLQYVNSQLLAHGFLHENGLSLDGLGKGDTERVVKCVLGMLSQRVDDMSCTEELTTKLRTLSYDHERLTSMYKTQTEKAANAEREMNLHKTRMTAATKSLQSSENAHKHTTAELQRTRTTLIGIRATHQTEIKKLEKEKERMVDRWSKLSDSQLRIGATPSGFTCSNINVVEASDVQLQGKGTGFLDVALEQAEATRTELLEQNRRLKGLLFSAANELQSILHAARSSTGQDPPPPSPSLLLSSGTVECAGDALTSMFTSLRSALYQSVEPTPCCSNRAPTPLKQSHSSESDEIARLQGVIDKLRSDLEESQKQASISATQTQQLFDRFAEEQRLASSSAADMSIDLMMAPARDEERQRLDARAQELEAERSKFTEAAIRLGREKAALEAERLKFLEEKRSWEVEQMLAELPPTPAPVAAAAASSSTYAAAASVLQSVKPLVIARRSPRHSVKKLKGKVASPRKTRVSRRSSAFGVSAPTPKAHTKVLPSYETEVLPSTLPMSSVPPSPSRPPPSFKTSMAAPPAPSPVQLASEFILPPPSPAASFPSLLNGRSSFPPPMPPIPKLELPPPDSLDDDDMDFTPESSTSAAAATYNPSCVPSTSSSLSSASEPLPTAPLPPIPSTPSARPFPMAKPFAQRMIHAYSPAKPSPLSRILMLGASPDSPEDPTGSGLKSLEETSESSMDTSICPPPPVRSLAEELGVGEDDDAPPQAPLRERQPARAPAPPQGARKPATLKEKGKAKAAAAPAPSKPRTRAGAALEKENVKRAKLSGPPFGPTGSGSAKSASSSSSSSTSQEAKKAPRAKPATRERARAGAGSAGGNVQVRTAPTKGGARRVPIGSAQAGVVPSWKG